MAGGQPRSGGGRKTELDRILANVARKNQCYQKWYEKSPALGSRRAKDLVDNAPKPVKEGITKEEAQSIKAKLKKWVPA